MRMRCKQDLQQEEFEELEKAILYGDAMDAQILGNIKRFPQNFHIGMIPDMTNFAKADVDTDAQLSCACSKGNLILNSGSNSAAMHSWQELGEGIYGPLHAEGLCFELE